jgi:hypothetical protein
VQRDILLTVTASSYMNKHLRIFSYILGSPSSYMTLHSIPSEFPYVRGKLSFLFYQCGAFFSCNHEPKLSKKYKDGLYCTSLRSSLLLTRAGALQGCFSVNCGLTYNICHEPVTVVTHVICCSQSSNEYDNTCSTEIGHHFVPSDYTVN